MCGRYTHLFKWKDLRRLMELVHWPEVELGPRYNVAPMQMAPVVRLNKAGEREGVMLKWGLVPFWAKDPADGSRSINARGETVFEKPAFRKAAIERRCLVPISGFYEWQAVEGEKVKRPHYIKRVDGEPIALGGLWEWWRDKEGAKGSQEGERLETFTILTTSPNALMKPLHDRMPVIVQKEDWEAWLDPKAERGAVEGLIRSYPKDDLEAVPVSRTVNSPRRDGPACIEPLTAGDSGKAVEGDTGRSTLFG